MPNSMPTILAKDKIREGWLQLLPEGWLQLLPELAVLIWLSREADRKEGEKKRGLKRKVTPSFPL